jgi:lysophospholipase L1-like esterase
MRALVAGLAVSLLAVGAIVLAVLRDPSGPPAGGAAAGQTLTEAQAALAGPEPAVVVLGDSTGDEEDEWVHLWARSLARERGAQVRDWDATAEAYRAPVTLGGLAPQVSVRNGSLSGARASYATERLERLLPTGTDLVLLSYGHNHGPADVAEVGELVDAVRRRAPRAVVVVVLQNPQLDDANAAVRREVARQAADRAVATLGVDEAFAVDPRPLETLLLDAVHPGPEGSGVWADAVEAALGP